MRKILSKQLLHFVFQNFLNWLSFHPKTAVYDWIVVIVLRKLKMQLLNHWTFLNCEYQKYWWIYFHPVQFNSILWIHMNLHDFIARWICSHFKIFLPLHCKLQHLNLASPQWTSYSVVFLRTLLSSVLRKTIE